MRRSDHPHSAPTRVLHHASQDHLQARGAHHSEPKAAYDVSGELNLIDRVKRLLFLLVLRKTRNNVVHTARILGVSLRTVRIWRAQLTGSQLASALQFDKPKHCGISSS